MKIKFYTAWFSYEGPDNAGCWYDDIELKSFKTKKAAFDWIGEMIDKVDTANNQTYYDIVPQTIST